MLYKIAVQSNLLPVNNFCTCGDALSSPYICIMENGEWEPDPGEAEYKINGYTLLHKVSIHYNIIHLKYYQIFLMAHITISYLMQCTSVLTGALVCFGL